MTSAIIFGSDDPIKPLEKSDDFVIGQLGLSLDGRIATHTGHSQYINHETGLRHLHRLRAACEAVLVGVGTVNADDPRLSVRLCEGSDPVRVIIDPRGRVFHQSRLFDDFGARVIIVTDDALTHPLSDKVEICPVPVKEGRIAVENIKRSLEARGLRRLLVEGGSKTLSSFINAGLLDRLHLITAPMLIGSGYPGLNLSAICKIDDALLPRVTLYNLGHDILYDCQLSGMAKKST